MLSNVISKPIRKLTKFTKKVTKGDLDLQFIVESNDEVGQLGEGLNYMILNIKQLLNQILHEQKQKRSYELKLIQSQIKPHFLYNTLELISSLSKLNRTGDVIKTSESLSTFYRIALSKGSDVISIKKELQNVLSYLDIVKTLYIDIIDYEINVTTDVYEYQIMKLTIQPIVENAIYHGIKPLNRKGMIRVDGFIEDGLLKIKVIDNGAGMTQETINNILDGKYEAMNKSFGLKSVDSRIKLYYGDAYGIDIKSSSDYGTV
ncbi:MAG TPA: histidine kinase [Ruminiclostridium sp.]